MKKKNYKNIYDDIYEYANNAYKLSKDKLDFNKGYKKKAFIESFLDNITLELLDTKSNIYFGSINGNLTNNIATSLNEIKILDDSLLPYSKEIPITILKYNDTTKEQAYEYRAYQEIKKLKAPLKESLKAYLNHYHNNPNHIYNIQKLVELLLIKNEHTANFIDTDMKYIIKIQTLTDEIIKNVIKVLDKDKYKNAKITKEIIMNLYNDQFEFIPINKNASFALKKMAKIDLITEEKPLESYNKEKEYLETLEAIRISKELNGFNFLELDKEFRSKMYPYEQQIKNKEKEKKPE